MSGKPRLLYLDNAAEFKSEALRRGCEQHGIRLDYRPPGQPHYGGIVERIIGTAMQMIHDELPGTTFSNPDQRGDYDSENKAALTLRELERWLTLAVGTYHGSVHNGLLQPPAARWSEAVARVGVPAVVTRALAFLVDFLPIIRRTLTRTGFVIDHIHYYADALKPWIARRDRLPAFLIRRDPRDISRIWGCTPESQKFPSAQLQSRHERIQVDELAVSLEGVMPVQQDVPPGRWRHLRDQRQRLGIASCLVLRQQQGQDRRVVEDDRVADQPGALVADLDFDVGAAGQFLLPTDLGDGRA